MKVVKQHKKPRYMNAMTAFCFLLFTSVLQATPLQNAPVSHEPLATIRAYTEMEKINMLIERIENLQNASFDRNGTIYDAKAAAEHLRLKLDKAGSSITTARQFIDELASKSSMSGKPYYIVYKSGVKVKVRDFLIAQLEEIEKE